MTHVIIKPENTAEWPKWTSSMDIYNGMCININNYITWENQVANINYINIDDKKINTSWLHKIDDIQPF